MARAKTKVIAKEAREEVQDRAAAKVPWAAAFTGCFKRIGLPGVVGFSGLGRPPTEYSPGTTLSRIN